jgi:hypothetical protein
MYLLAAYLSKYTRRQTINSKNLEELKRRGLLSNIVNQLENEIKARVMKNGAPMLPLTRFVPTFSQ